MGLHTWFHKDRKLYEEIQQLAFKETQFEDGEIWLDELDLLNLENLLDELEAKNKTNYHDCFRTTKREPNGEYCLDVIYSKKECADWLLKNKEFIYNVNEERINDFWDEFPNGVIDFG